MVLLEESLFLARSPCGPIGMRRPDDLTRELFGVPSSSTRRDRHIGVAPSLPRAHRSPRKTVELPTQGGECAGISSRWGIAQGR
jgi:hypothetical protein